MENKKIISPIPWWCWLVFIDLILVFITAGRFNEYPQSWRLIPAFDLAIEMNLAVWWHGVQLISVAMLCYSFYLDKTKGFDRPWLSLAAVFVILAIDETCSLHERLPHSIGFAVFIPVILFLASYPLIVLLKDYKNQKTGVFVLFCFGLYAFVFALEIIAHVVDFPEWVLPLRIAFEEGTELLGTLIILFGLLALRVSVPENTIQKLIPKPQLTSAFRLFLWVGMFLQVIICLFVLPELDDLDIRGNPDSFYPTIINFTLSCYFFWKFKAIEGKGKTIAIVLSGVFLLSSMGCMYNLQPLIPMAELIIPETSLIEGFRFLYIGQIISAICILIISEKSLTPNNLLFIAILCAIYVLSIFYDPIIQPSLLLGLFTFFIGFYISRIENKA